MSRSGYENYSVGPFDAFWSSLHRGERKVSQTYETRSGLTSGESGRLPVLPSSSPVSVAEHTALEEELVQLLQEEQLYEQRIEEACDAVSEKERLVEEQKKALEKQQQSLVELCQYGKSMEQKLSVLREQIAQLRQQLVHAKTYSQNNRVFTSHSQGEQTRAIASVLPVNYTPQPGAVEALTQFYQIPVEFIRQKLIEFRIHYTETREQRVGWDRIFYTWVVNGWKREQYNEPISADFRPSDALLQELMTEGVSSDFCEQERQGFILYWQEQRATFTAKLWQERFKQWIKRAWRRHQANEEYSRPSYATTAEFADTSRADKYKFDFDEDE